MGDGFRANIRAVWRMYLPPIAGKEKIVYLQPVKNNSHEKRYSSREL
jgi:hypothetical protein